MTRVIPADLGDPGHAAALVDLLDEYARSPTGGGTPLSAFARENLAAQLRARSNIHVLLAFEGERAIGLANCIEGFSTFACRPLLNIHDLAVTGERRGRGVGRFRGKERWQVWRRHD